MPQSLAMNKIKIHYMIIKQLIECMESETGNINNRKNIKCIEFNLQEIYMLLKEDNKK